MSAGTRTWEVYYIPNGDVVPFKLRNVLDVRTTHAGKASTNTAEILLTSVQDEGISSGEVIYKADDTIKVYAAEGEVDTTDSTHLIGIYTIQNSEIQAADKIIKLTMINKTYDVLSKIWFGDVDDTPPNIIENVYQTVTNDINALTTIASTRSDLSSFDSVEYYCVNKTAYEVMTELSQPNYTGDDRTYIFWVDENNRLYWQYPGQTPESLEFNYKSNDVINIKTTKMESSVVSMIIYNAGVDKNGNDYVDFYLAPNASTIKGQMRYEEMKYLSKDLQETGFWTSATNEQVQTALKLRGDDNSRRIVEQIGTGLWQAEVEHKGSKFNYGDLHYVSCPTEGFPQTPLRLIRIVHKMGKNGWNTLLTLEEDAEALILE